MSQDPKLLPPNSTPLEQAVDATAAARLGVLPVFVRRLWDAAMCPPAWLPGLAWAFSVDFWRSDWPEERKRRVIAASPLVHRLKGTVAAVKTAARAIAGASPVELIEWFQAGGPARTFHARVEVDITEAAGLPDAGPELPRELRTAVEGSANLRSRFEIRLIAHPSSGASIGARVRPPMSRGGIAGETPVVRPFGAGLQFAGGTPRHAARGRLSGVVTPVRPLSGSVVAAAHIRAPAIGVHLTVSGA